MNETEKLQKAVGVAVASGYQLDREAFEFLKTIADRSDPAELVRRSIEQISSLKEKTFLIGKEILEQAVEMPKPAEEIIDVNNVQDSQPSSAPQLREMTISSSFRSYAESVEADIKVLADAGSKIGSSGTIEDCVRYFQDRFKQMDRILRQRIDVKSAASIIDAVRSQTNTRLKVIGMVTEKRESKQRIIFTVEDLTANATVLVPQNAQPDLQKRARSLLLDQVVCVSVLKTRGRLLIAEDIILPDVSQRTQRKAMQPIYAVLTSDLHIGSSKFTREAFNRFVLWLNGKYGNGKLKEIASHVKYVLVAGDIVDGVGVYPNQIKELAVKDISKQYRLASRFIEQIPDYIEVIITPGNHDAPRKALPQPPISNAFLELLKESRNVYSLGSPCQISLHGVEVLMFHGRSLDDVIASVPDMSHAHPERAMRLLLQSRHLAPVYGGKTPLSPENRDSLVIEHVPDIFHAGHVHAVDHATYRGVMIVNSGCWQEQTEYMRRNGFVPTPAQVPVVNLQTSEVAIIPFA